MMPNHLYGAMGHMPPVIPALRRGLYGEPAGNAAVASRNRFTHKRRCSSNCKHCRLLNCSEILFSNERECAFFVFSSTKACSNSRMARSLSFCFLKNNQAKPPINPANATHNPPIHQANRRLACRSCSVRSTSIFVKPCAVRFSIVMMESWY